MPDFVDDGGRVLDRAQQQALLERIAAAGLEERLARGVKGGHPPEVYRDRLVGELAMVERMGFAGYFLVVEEFCRWARCNGVPLGPGRGSAAGSLVVWCCGITDIDPIEHGLYFERFLNPSRVSWPDIDTDICKSGRGRVISHLKERYGADSVGRIVSYKALQGKTALKDVGRALGISYFRLNAICSGAPNLVAGKAPTVAWMVGKTHSPECAEARKRALAAAANAGLPPPAEPPCQCPHNVPALRDAVDTDPIVAECVSHARALEGCVRESGVHASGIVVSRGPLPDWTPTFRAGKGERGELCSQWAMEEVEDAGLVKLDALGLSTVTHLDLCLKLVAARRGSGVPALTLATISLDDAPTYATIARGDTLGVFQMGRMGLRRMLRKLKPDRFGDLSAAVALYRPGPLKSGMTEDYIERKHGRQVVEPIHPSVDAVLRETYSTICFQEQTMAVIRTLSGCSLADADAVRKIMGKKKPELLAKERAKFMVGVARAGVCDAATAEKAWGVVEASSMYSFNKSHSVAYAFLGYWTAYLKFNHPIEFYAAWLTVLCGEADKSGKIAEAVYDARAHGVEVLPPCALRSLPEFAPETHNGAQAVRFGLHGLRGLGVKCVASLLAARAAAPLESMSDLLRRVHATKRDLASLVGSGACDALLSAEGWTRAQALAHLPALADWARRTKLAPKPVKLAPSKRARAASRKRAKTAQQQTLPGLDS